MLSTAMNGLILGNRMEQWVHAAFILAIGWTIAKIISWSGATLFNRWAMHTPNKTDDALVYSLRRPLVTLVTVLAFVAGYKQLDVPARLDLWMERVFHVAVALSLTWAVVRALDAMTRTLLVGRNTDGGTPEHAQFIPIVRSTINGLVWGLGIVVALNNAGYNVGALLAGIGIGGLALAMAAKDTLANIFGGITVFTDKPFQVGDRVRLGGYDGVVQEVGIRSTRIRTMEGPVVVVPNYKFTESILENVSSEASRRVRHELGLVYSTTNEQIEEAIAILHAIVHDHKDELEAEHAAYFSAFKEYALNIIFIYHIRKGGELFTVQTKVHLDLLKRFRSVGLEFAYPTTVQFSGDAKA